MGLLIVVGALLLASPVLHARLDTIAFGAKGFELKLTQQIAGLGAPKTAELLDHSELGRLVDSYSVIREELRDKNYLAARTQLQDALVSRAKGFATQNEIDPDEVRKLFPKAAPIVRVLLIALMKGDPRLLDAAIIASAIRRPATPNEQYHALELVNWYWSWFTPSNQAMILATVATADIPMNSDRRPLADKLLNRGTGKVAPWRCRLLRCPSP
jgi:hypothetical protein